ncbi:MAG: acyl-CoA thioesterase [Rubrivivax sp.]
MTCFERTRRIRFSHCDPAGIVFFPQYLVMLGDHVEDWVSEGLGIPYATLIGARRTGLPTVRLECDFRAISRLGEDVTYSLRVTRLGTRSLTLATEVLGPARDLRAAFVQVLVSTDLDTHRAVELPPDLRAAAMAFAPAPQS